MVTTIVTEFNQIVGLPEEEAAEWATYAESAQTDLQGIYTLALQSQEIGIKSRIARVSPYLLLKRHEAKPIAQGTHDYDFSDFPTIDAGDLIRAHNTFCSTPLPQDFADDFERLRRDRNKIARLGVFNQKLDPHRLIDLLFKHYAALYPERRWLPDRLVFASSGRWAEFDGGGDWSPTGAVLSELWEIEDELSDAQREIVFSQPASLPRYVCPSCADLLDRHTMGSEPYGADVRTAVATEDGLMCRLCAETFSVREQPCNDEDCVGDHLVGAPEHVERCVGCGQKQD